MHESESGDHVPPSPRVGVAVTALAGLLERLEDMNGVEEMSEAISEFAVAHLGADFAGVSLRPAHGTAVRLDDEDDPFSRPEARSTVIVEMTRFGGRSVTLDLYSRTEDSFDPVARTLLTAMARIIGHSVHQLERRTNLEKALTTREMIGQAQGILMERFHLTSAQAMQYLRRMSQDSQEKIREIATQVVSGDVPPPLD